MFGCWRSVFITLLVTSHVLAGITNREGEGEVEYVGGGDSSGGRQGRPITVVGGTQAAGDARVGGNAFSGRADTPGVGVFPGGSRQATGEGGRFAPGGAGSPGVNLGGSGGRFSGPGGATGPVVGGGSGRFGPGSLLGPGAALGGGGGGRFGGSGQGTRVVEAQGIPTLTKTVTIDHFVTLTDTALHTIPVTLTDFTARTSIVQTVQVAQTPVDDRVALRTDVVVRPRTLTVTCTKSYFRFATDVPVVTVTITHSSYVIKQSTYTTTATQVVTLTSTTVHTAVHTQRQDRAVYHTVTNTVVIPGHYYQTY